MKPSTMNGIPTFRILDYRETIDFMLGAWAFISIGNTAQNLARCLHAGFQGPTGALFSENERFRAGSAVFAETKGIDELNREFSGKTSGIPIGDIMVTPWGTRQLEIKDPSGNLLRLNETIEAG
jgi:hypothetical protein